MAIQQQPMTEPVGIPVIILKEGTQRSYGREALRANIMAVRAIAQILKTTYGPKGMDKMLVDSLGDITITNNGATILDKMDVAHPAAKMLVQISKGQEDEAGDGTKTTVIFAGELLKEAEKLLDINIHPTIIVEGYKEALRKASEVIESIAEPVSYDDVEKLKLIAKTSLNSKAVAEARDYFAELAVEAVRTVAERRGDRWYVDLNNIQIVKKHGGSLRDTRLVRGIVLDKEVVHPDMPRRVENARIALLDTPLEIEKPEIDLEISITSPEQIKALYEKQERILQEKIEKIAATGANVVITQKGIDDVAQHFLAKKGILAVRRVKRSDIEKIARATGARIVTDIEDLRPEDLGYAELVEERKVGEDKMVFIEGAKNPKSVTILLRGGFERLVDEAERSLHDALSVVADAIMDGKIVAGGGAVEAEVAKVLYEYASKLPGKTQLAVEAFARAVEALPQALAHNAGHDPIEVLVKLRSAHEKPENKWYGVDLDTGEIVDMWSRGVLEPMRVKLNALKAATEVASLILRIDDVIAARKEEEEKEEKRGGEEE
ncbi:thermosome beta subunit [Aeropyrum pernix K1]|uniref:Thermosome subunit beta n=1 Tax=Aeropyrum pernix (strain ATCC 700893 / DSM 11879 / JCM 9820 / NBRC 100138 / K1) TaxID=272557 RepID=THSB_AERPE|nr:thermosome subunit beta [Aeropyrum pernix]Q9YA66.2 RecName: Full=Thermosome subunit beta; AltName: Full=Chaperonin subunit beta; AltName: Full=Thermosome subunit 2 [Aeropyrum pernix K1]BAA81083.2 thermosome beta subunit [Aeropyrum pernix K1]